MFNFFLNRSRVSTSTFAVAFLSLAACSSGGGGGGGDSSTPSNSSQSSSATSSSASAKVSHNSGQNCMNSGCHDGSGSADAFTVAGTIYSGGSNVQKNATVNLYLHNTNTLVASLDTDDSGNFYTTEAVDGLSDGSGGLVTGVDVEVEGPSGLRNMPGVISSGACSGCHGQSNGRITVN